MCDSRRLICFVLAVVLSLCFSGRMSAQFVVTDPTHTVISSTGWMQQVQELVDALEDVNKYGKLVGQGSDAVNLIMSTAKLAIKDYNSMRIISSAMRNSTVPNASLYADAVSGYADTFSDIWKYVEKDSKNILKVFKDFKRGDPNAGVSNLVQFSTDFAATYSILRSVFVSKIRDVHSEYTLSMIHQGDRAFLNTLFY